MLAGVKLRSMAVYCAIPIVIRSVCIVVGTTVRGAWEAAAS